MVIEPQYYQVGNFSNGLCRFKERDFFTARWGFIDTTGKVVISQRFSEVADFSEDFAMFYENNKYGYADKTGKVIIEAKYDAGVLYKENKKVVFSAGSFSEGLAGVNINDKYGFIDKTGKVVIEPKFNSVGDFKEGLASVYDYEKGKKLKGDKKGKKNPANEEDAE